MFSKASVQNTQAFIVATQVDDRERKFVGSRLKTDVIVSREQNLTAELR